MAGKSKLDVNSVFENQFANKYKGENKESIDYVEIKGVVKIEPDDQEEVTKIKQGRPKKVENKQKTFYLPDDIIATVRRIAFDRNCDQSSIVNEALRVYFEREGY